jgi:glycosyltransferase involved in cell wall biosynthesis
MKNTSNKPSKKLCMITTSAESLVSLHRGLYLYFQSKGWRITTISGPGEDHLKLLRVQGAETVIMPFVRHPSPLVDLWSLFRLWFYLLYNRFDIIHVSTPKASLLGTLSSFLSLHGNRVLTYRGRVFENYCGQKRRFYLWLDSISFQFSKSVIPVCSELMQCMIKEGGCNPKKLKFIGASSNGVDTEVFKRDNIAIEQGKKLRKQMGIAVNDLVIISVGRIRREKGTNELVRAFECLRPPQGQTIHLLLVGPFERIDPLDEDVERSIKDNKKIHTPGWVNDPVPWYTMADLVAFPTYREGFGNTSIEAAAMELPIVASDIMGCREGVVHGQTGMLVPKQDSKKLVESLQLLIDSQSLRLKMGQSGRKWVEMAFQSKQRWDGILNVYDQLLIKKAG